MTRTYNGARDSLFFCLIVPKDYVIDLSENDNKRVKSGLDAQMDAQMDAHIRGFKCSIEGG